MCSPQIKVLDGHPALCGMFGDKRQIVAVAAPLRASGARLFKLALMTQTQTERDARRSMKLRASRVTGIELPVKFVQDGADICS